MLKLCIEKSKNPQELDMSTNEEGVDPEADDYRASLSPDISSPYIATRQSKKQNKIIYRISFSIKNNKTTTN